MTTTPPSPQSGSSWSIAEMYGGYVIVTGPGKTIGMNLDRDLAFKIVENHNKALDAARSDALEEAAIVVDKELEDFWWRDRVEKKIRALKSKGASEGGAV